MAKRSLYLATFAYIAVLASTGCEYETETSTSALGVHGRCVSLSGSFASEVVPCDEEGGLLCTSGNLTDLVHEASYNFVANSFAGTYPVEQFTGNSVIEYDSGLLMGEDTGTLDVVTGAFQTNVTLVDGTGALAGASGYITATGVADLSIGVTSGTYVGELCLTRDRRKPRRGPHRRGH